MKKCGSVNCGETVADGEGALGPPYAGTWWDISDHLVWPMHGLEKAEHGASHAELSGEG